MPVDEVVPWRAARRKPREYGVRRTGNNGARPCADRRTGGGVTRAESQAQAGQHPAPRAPTADDSASPPRGAPTTGPAPTTPQPPDPGQPPHPASTPDPKPDAHPEPAPPPHGKPAASS